MGESSKKNDDSWFGSWINAAKNKSTEVMEFVKKDLEEFSSAVKNEATTMVSNTGTAIGKTFKLDEPDSTANTMKKSLSSFIGQVNDVLNPSPDDSDAEALVITEGSETVALTKLQQSIYLLQKDDNTFLTDPVEDPELSSRYQCWLDIVDGELSNERIAKLLLQSAQLKDQYTKFVPDIISNETFWKRYLFKKALLEDNIAIEEEAEKRNKCKDTNLPITEDNLEWEKDDFTNEVTVLSEEDQMRILEDYEKEVKEKQTKGKPVKTGKADSPRQQAETQSSNPSNVKSDSNLSSNSSSADDDWEKVTENL